MSASEQSPVVPNPAPRGLAATLVARPVTLFMLFLTLIGTGFLAYLRIPLTLLPEGLTSSSLSIDLPYPGAGPREVEDQITRPVEDVLRTIPGVKEIMSWSSEGESDISVEFSSNADMDVAYGEVRDRLERVRAQLPPEMDRYRIRRWNSSTDIPILWIGVQYDAEAEDPFGPIERIAVPRLEGVDGVATVGTWGLVDEAVRIFVDFDKVLGYGIDLGDVIRRMQADNFTLPAGRVDDGDRTFALRVDARYRSMEDIERYPVGQGLVLADIAEIVRARAYRDWVWRIDGRAAVGMSISRESDQNTIEVCSRVEDVLADFAQDPRMEGVTFNLFWSQKDTILEAIDGLRASALWGGLFAVIVLFFFLRDLRMTLLASLAIPSSLLAGLMAVYFGGQTLNLVSLAGFTLGIGMLVDNAVVVIENIARKRAEGARRLQAAATGAGEVGLAVLTATLTSIVVFLPLVFMGGERNMRIMLREVGLPISYSLAASLLVALVFLPTFTARLMRQDAGRRDIERLSGRLVRTYERSASWVLAHRFVSFCLVVLVAFGALAADASLPASRAGGDDHGGLTMRVEMPSTYALPETNGVFRKFEAWAEEHKDEFGYDTFSARFSRRGGSLNFWPRDDLDPDQEEQLPNRLRESVPEFPGVTTRIGWDNENTSKRIRIDLRGPDFDVLAGIADDLEERLAALTVEVEGKRQPLLENVTTDLEDGLDEVHLTVDRDRSSELGVNPEGLRGMIAWGLGGQRLPDLQEGDRELRMQIEYGQSDEESLEFLRNLGVPTTQGTMVPLSSVAGLGFDKTVRTLVRRNGRTSTGVSAEPTIDNLYLVMRHVDAVLENYPFPEGVTWAEEGGRRDLESDFAELGITLLFSVVLVYLLMAILLESVILPLSILTSIPLALMGVSIALAATGRTKDPMVYVGMILLAGIVVNNAIVLLDRVQRLRVQGVERTQALIQGGKDRLRPILMTALTTIFGLMPMAMPQLFPGDTQQSGYEGMAITVAGGLAFATFFTLFVVPLFYSFFDDLGGLFAKTLPWVPASRRTTAPANAPVGEPVSEPAS